MGRDSGRMGCDAGPGLASPRAFEIGLSFGSDGPAMLRPIAARLSHPSVVAPLRFRSGWERKNFVLVGSLLEGGRLRTLPMIVDPSLPETICLEPVYRGRIHSSSGEFWYSGQGTKGTLSKRGEADSSPARA